MGLGSKTVWKCDICDHEWLSRNNDKPLRCAGCKSPYWDKSSQTIIERKIKKPQIKGSKIK